jgi:hypothetical protein
VTIGCAVWLSGCIGVYAVLVWRAHVDLMRSVARLDASIDRLEATGQRLDATTVRIVARDWTLQQGPAE